MTAEFKSYYNNLPLEEQHVCDLDNYYDHGYIDYYERVALEKVGPLMLDTHI